MLGIPENKIPRVVPGSFVSVFMCIRLLLPVYFSQANVLKSSASKISATAYSYFALFKHFSSCPVAIFNVLLVQLMISNILTPQTKFHDCSRYALPKHSNLRKHKPLNFYWFTKQLFYGDNSYPKSDIILNVYIISKKYICSMHALSTFLLHLGRFGDSNSSNTSNVFTKRGRL